MGDRSVRSQVNRQVLDEASEWFAAFRLEEPDAQARAAFSAWLKRSPEHIQAYLDLTRLWTDLCDSGSRARIDVEQLVSRARGSEAEVISLDPSHRPSSQVAPARRHRSTKARWLTALAGAATIAAAVALRLMDHTVYSTGVGEQRSIRLTDGSSVDLNALSRVVVHFGKGAREIELTSGQALFSVAKDKTRPFVVIAGDRKVIAVGTQFDVYRKPTGTLVSVIEGTVAVDEAARHTAQPALLYVHAGEQAVLTAQTAVKSAHPDVTAATGWLQKKLVFEATPLAEVVAEFNRYNSRRLIVEDPRLGALGISGVYSSTDPSSLLLFLRDHPGIRITETDQDVRIGSGTP